MPVDKLPSIPLRETRCLGCNRRCLTLYCNDCVSLPQLSQAKETILRLDRPTKAARWNGEQMTKPKRD